MNFPHNRLLYGRTAPKTNMSITLYSLSFRCSWFQPIQRSLTATLKTGSPRAKSPTNFSVCSSKTRKRNLLPYPWETGTLHIRVANLKRSEKSLSDPTWEIMGENLDGSISFPSAKYVNKVSFFFEINCLFSCSFLCLTLAYKQRISSFFE